MEEEKVYEKVRISKPTHGWSILSMYDIDVSLSYIEDIPLNWLTELACGLRERKPVVLFADEEGSEARILLDYGISYLIREKDETFYHKYDFGILEFAEAFNTCAKQYLPEWVKWIYTPNREETIKKLIAEVDEALRKEKSNGFGNRV